MENPNETGTTRQHCQYRNINEIHRRESPEDNGDVHGTNEEEGLNSQKKIEEEKYNKIPVHVSIVCDRLKSYKPQKYLLQRSHNRNNLVTVKRSNKAVQALSLPTVVNINP